MIFHIVKRNEWAQAIRLGSYAPASLQTHGFIHCSTLDQIVDTANQFYRGNGDLVLLCIEESSLTEQLKFESPASLDDPRAELSFPHLYGSLDPVCVGRVVKFPCRADGSFELPTEFQVNDSGD